MVQRSTPAHRLICRLRLEVPKSLVNIAQFPQSALRLVGLARHP
jgi:hypothetical protein